MTTTAEHATAQAEDHLATAGQDPLANLGEATAAGRIEAGRLLAYLRHTARFSQVQLARRIGYSATVVAHAELGRRPVSAEFWELADDALAASGRLTAYGIRIRDLAMARREEQRRRDKARHAERLAQLLPLPHGEDDTVPAAPAVPAAADTTSAVGRCPHCNQPVTLVTRIAAPPDAGTVQEPVTGELANSSLSAHTARR
jgi:transcriptional regulator with XRE-family HTH domain